MRDHLGVGVRPELDALRLQLGAQLAEVLDDAVLHHHQPAGEVGVRMGVTLAGLAVGGPARVTDADVTFDGRFDQPVGQVAEFSNVAADGDAAALNDGDARRIIAAIFQPAQPVQDDLGRVARADVTDDTTHRDPPLLD